MTPKSLKETLVILHALNSKCL